MTECNQSSFGFEASGRREIVARFDGGTISSDGGAFLLRQTDRRLNLLPRLAECFLDGRNQKLVDHKIEEMLAQRIYGLALGYEDINDHEQLRHDPVFGILAGRAELDQPLAGKSTLNRMELGTGINNRYKKITFWKEALDELLVTLFIEAQQSAPEEIVLDVDTTDLPLHGKQEGRFFHGYYDSYCYLPLYVFCGDHILCARLREANHDAAFGCLAEIRRIVGQIREAWPEVKIVLRGDSGFCRNELMSWCEGNGVDFVFGLARNQRLRKIIGQQMHEATQQWNRTGKPARVFTEFDYRTRKKKNGGWDRERRVVAKAEHIDGKENPRFVVTSLAGSDWEARKLYEELYCARGEMENRIKEQFSLFADRVSTETMRANQMRLYLSAMAYVLVSGLRRLGLKATALAEAQVSTIRTKLLKIGAQIRVTVRKVWVSMASSYPWQGLYEQVWTNLQLHPKIT
ncbi:MAG TPA: IS1380 family transposase [Candidatus Acidoferrales bacterium]|nr:IS1380 family transposase [Candidatus Acidoferrales bacterium]